MSFWQWWAFGGILMVIEVFAPGYVFMWLGASAVLTGLLVLVWPGLAWQWQFLTFALLMVGTAMGWFLYRRHYPPPLTDEPTLNRRGAQYVGQTATLVAPVVNGRGRVRLGDSTWSVTGPDLPAGTRVRIVGSDGTRLQVAPLEPI
jgi:membrane protein implicated in regulation of membrane protease activity